MSWIINVAGCYLGDKDKLVDDPKDAHKYHYKRDAETHRVTWCLFNSWCCDRSIAPDVKVQKFIKVKK